MMYHILSRIKNNEYFILKLPSNVGILKLCVSITIGFKKTFKITKLFVIKKE